MKFCLVAVLVLSSYWLIAFQSANAQPVPSGISPRYAKIGGKTKITVSGKLPDWPVEFWFDDKGISAKCQMKKGEWEIQCDENVPAGLHYFRLIDPKGCSELIPVFVGFQEGVSEKEPNDSSEKSQEVSIPNHVSGVLSKAGDVDSFRVELKKGQTFVASLIANPVFGKSIDATLQLTDHRGFVVFQNDDEKNSDPQITYKIKKDGVYLVRVFAFPSTPNSSIRFAGGGDYRYLLQMTCGKFIDGAQRLFAAGDGEVDAVGNNIPEKFKLNVARVRDSFIAFHKDAMGSQPLHILEKFEQIGGQTQKNLTLPCAITGRILNKRQVDEYQLNVKKGDKIRLNVRSREFGFSLDPKIVVETSDGKKLTEKDDIAKTNLDSQIDLSAKKDTAYKIKVSDATQLGGSRFLYLLTAKKLTPGFSLTVSKNAFSMTREKSLEIEINIARLNGFVDDIEISLEKKIDGIEAKSVVSKNKGTTSKKIKLILKSKSDALLNQAFRIQGISKKSKKKKLTKFTLSNGEQYSQLFLTHQATTKK